MTFIYFIGKGLLDIIGNISNEVNSIIGQFLSIIRDIISYIYTFFLRFWNFIMENPRQAIMLFANMYVFML